ncbi:hypothetical protein GIB67_030758 [Kingdonia uniflora]|uniref:Uncharacterized protein n=1 Tax=Kingdonia uniflora TaxID=39325 RepID=A0A7J7L354_9MAGN|nr:hypothetical protein GIB67_030758 [Kingdonia uniflora]
MTDVATSFLRDLVQGRPWDRYYRKPVTDFSFSANNDFSKGVLKASGENISDKIDKMDIHYVDHLSMTNMCFRGVTHYTKGVDDSLVTDAMKECVRNFWNFASSANSSCCLSSFVEINKHLNMLVYLTKDFEDLPPFFVKHVTGLEGFIDIAASQRHQSSYTGGAQIALEFMYEVLSIMKRKLKNNRSYQRYLRETRPHEFSYNPIAQTGCEVKEMVDECKAKEEAEERALLKERVLKAAENPFRMLCFLYDNVVEEFIKHVSEQVQEFDNDISEIMEIVMDNLHLVDKYVDIEGYGWRSVADRGMGARDNLVSYLDNIDIAMVADDATRLKLGESVENLKHTLLSCRYTEKEREERASFTYTKKKRNIDFETLMKEEAEIIKLEELYMEELDMKYEKGKLKW